METMTEAKTTTAKPAAITPIKGADLIVACLEREGVDHVFAYPGAATMEIHQSLKRSKQIRTILPLSLSYDHRLIDGAEAARFTRWVAEAIEEPLLLSLEGVS